MKFNTPDSLMSNFETILETDQFTIAFTSWCKVFYQCGIACWYNQSKSQPYCRQWPRLLTVRPVSTDAQVELRYFGLSVPWKWSHNRNWELWERCVSFINGIQKLKWSSTSGGVFIMMWSWATLTHCTKVPLLCNVLRTEIFANLHVFQQILHNKMQETDDVPTDF